MRRLTRSTAAVFSLAVGITGLGLASASAQEIVKLGEIEAQTGALNTYGGAGGLALFGDLRFGPTGRYQLDVRMSWGFPVSWLMAPPYLSGLLAFGARIF